MKKIAAGAAVLAAAGFTGLSMAPATAAPIVFENCSQAAQYGVYNIPAGAPGYGTHLDRPVDGVGCEKDGVVYNASLVPGYVAPVTNVPVTPVAPVAEQPVADGVFDNCTEARAAGAVNIPASDPRYGLHLDRDRDGFGCDSDVDFTEGDVQTDVIVDWVPESWNTGQYSQMGQVPAGAADTGVVVEDDSPAGGVALGGGLALAAAAGAAVAGRRRAARA